MTLRATVRIALAVLAVAAAGCSPKSPTAPWPPNTDSMIFGELTDFGLHQVEFQAFGGSKYDAMTIDSTEHNTGSVSLRFKVPDPGDPSGGYAGGAFVASHPRSLANYNALSFWVKASRATTLNEVGLGNDNTGGSKYTAWRTAVPMKTWWTQVIIPIPLAARLGEERGLFYLSEGPQSGSGLTMWVDDIEYVYDPTITDPRPQLTSQTVSTVVGAPVNLSGSTRTSFTVGGVAGMVVQHMPGYFSYNSSAPAVAAVVGGAVQVVGPGSSTITASLGSVNATGSVIVNATVPPTTAAPTPTVSASSVISLFSGAYPNVPVENWRAFGSPSVQYQTLSIAGNETKLYTGLAGGFVGIQFTTPLIDASAMTHLHLDVWVPSDTTFRVKLVDFGADGVFGGGNDTQHELTFGPSTTPALVDGEWVGLEIPLANFTALTSRSHLAQLILSGTTPTVFVDNIYFHQ